MAARKNEDVGGGKKTVDELRAEYRHTLMKLRAAVAHTERALDALDEAAGVRPMPRGSKPSDYFEYLLKESGRAIEVSQLVEEAFELGAARDTKDALANVDKAITQLKKVKGKDKLFEFVQRGRRELVGLAEWGEEKFR